MEAAGADRAVLLGVSEGGPLCSLFAATYPEKTEALVMIGSYARRLRDADYPWGPTREERDALLPDDHRRVGRAGRHRRARAVACADDPAFRDWWAAYLRMGASPGAAVALTRMNAEIDVRDVLPSIRVPTLVMHRTGDRCLKVEEGPLPRVADSRRDLRRAARRRSPAVCRRSGRDALGDRGVPVARPSSGRSRARARHGADRHVRRRRTRIRDLLRRLFDARVRVVSRAAAATDRGSLVAMFDGPGRAVHAARRRRRGRQSRIVARRRAHRRMRAAGGDAPVVALSAAIAAAARRARGERLADRDRPAGGYGILLRGSRRRVGGVAFPCRVSGSRRHLAVTEGRSEADDLVPLAIQRAQDTTTASTSDGDRPSRRSRPDCPGTWLPPRL